MVMVLVMVLGLISLAPMLGTTGAAPQRSSGSAAIPMGGRGMVLDVQAGRLSVQLQEVPWAVVLEALARQCGLTVRLQGRLEGTVTAAFEGLPLEQGLRRLFRMADLAFVYAGAAPYSRVTQLWIWPRGPDSPPTPPEAPHGPVGILQDSMEAVLVQASMAAESGEGRQRALAALGERGDPHDPRVREVLREALQDPAVAIRDSAVDALAALGDEAAVEELGWAVLEDPGEEVRNSAAHALGQLASPRALPALTQALADPVVTVRQNAAEALGRIGGMQALEALQQALHDEMEEVREVGREAWRQLTGENWREGGRP
jgi:HEAT repeats/PBS lyase HEAT-like repeat